jgi:hypothetical protein
MRCGLQRSAVVAVPCMLHSQLKAACTDCLNVLLRLCPFLPGCLPAALPPAYLPGMACWLQLRSTRSSSWWQRRAQARPRRCARERKRADTHSQHCVGGPCGSGNAGTGSAGASSLAMEGRLLLHAFLLTLLIHVLRFCRNCFCRCCCCHHVTPRCPSTCMRPATASWARSGAPSRAAWQP